MSLITVTIKTPKGNLLGSIQWQHNKISFCNLIDDGIKQAINRWCTRGLQEWVGEKLNKRRRFTSANDPNLPIVISEYLRRQFGFITSIIITP